MTLHSILRFGLFALLVLSGDCLMAKDGAPPAAVPAAAPAAPAESKVDNDYKIGPGDTLHIFVARNPELTTTVPVRPDGKITTPLVEDMVAVGKTSSGLARDIEKVLSEYVKSPTVNVIVMQPVNAFSQVKIIGQVQRPQSIAYREGMTVLDAVLQVGGPTPYAAGNRSKLVRTLPNGKTQEFKIQLDKLVNSGNMKDNLPLKPGDVLVVPASRF